MNILLINDDGIDSPLLACLCRAAAARRHHVAVCAPMTQQSAKSHSFTLDNPIKAHPREMEGADSAWAIEGTPVDCACIGLMHLFPNTQLVISGINHGYNAGLSTYPSGTVGAARAAAFHGVKALALSAHTETPVETVTFFAEWATRLGEQLMREPLPGKAVCNVNVPPVAIHELREPVFCPLSTTMWADGYAQRESPRGDTYFWLLPYHENKPTEGSDLDMLAQNHITCTLLTPTPCLQEGYAYILKNL